MLKLVSALETPFDSVLDYYNSFRNYNIDDIYYTLLEYVKFGKEKYERNVNLNIVYKNEELFYLIDTDKPEYIIGFGHIGDTHINYHSCIYNSGCLSYCIRPNERKKGYGTKLLKLLLMECKNFGLKEVCVSCFATNIGSKKVIENNGGILELEFFHRDKLALKYWIPTKEKKEGKVLCKTIPSQFKGIRKNH